MVVLQHLRVNMVVSWVIEWSKSWMSHWRTFRNFTNWAWAIWDLSNHDLFRIIPDLGSQQRITLSLESICTIPSQARASDVKMSKLRQHSSYRIVPCFVDVFGTIRGTWDQSDDNPGMLFRCPADICSNITNCDVQWPGVLITRKIGQVSLVGCMYDWYNRCSGRKFILSIPKPDAQIHLAVDSTTVGVSKVHWFKMEVCLKWEMC